MSDKEDRQEGEELAEEAATRGSARRGSKRKKAGGEAAGSAVADKAGSRRAAAKTAKEGEPDKGTPDVETPEGRTAAATGERPGGESKSPGREKSEAAGQTDEKTAKEQGELSEEELRRIIEEQMEKITVKDVVSQMMASLASLAYQKLGLPESVNMKYRDFNQARMAIDALKGLLTSLEGKVEESELSPFRGTLANLQMNYVRLVKPSG